MMGKILTKGKDKISQQILLGIIGCSTGKQHISDREMYRFPDKQIVEQTRLVSSIQYI